MTDKPSDDQDWFSEEATKAPMKLVRDHLAVGHGTKRGKPIVILAMEIDNEPLVFGMNADRADHVAKLLRTNAGAARALEEQEPDE